MQNGPGLVAASPPLISQVSVLEPVSLNVFSLEKTLTCQSLEVILKIFQVIRKWCWGALETLPVWINGKKGGFGHR